MVGGGDHHDGMVAHTHARTARTARHDARPHVTHAPMPGTRASPAVMATRTHERTSLRLHGHQRLDLLALLRQQRVLVGEVLLQLRHLRCVRTTWRLVLHRLLQLLHLPDEDGALLGHLVQLLGVRLLEPRHLRLVLRLELSSRGLKLFYRGGAAVVAIIGRSLQLRDAPLRLVQLGLHLLHLHQRGLHRLQRVRLLRGQVLLQHLQLLLVRLGLLVHLRGVLCARGFKLLCIGDIGGIGQRGWEGKGGVCGGEVRNGGAAAGQLSAERRDGVVEGVALVLLVLVLYWC